MSLKYRNNQGVETPVAGLNGQNGSLVPSVALYQSGTIPLTDDIPQGQYKAYTVTLNSPMPDMNYVIAIDCNRTYALCNATSKTINGFVVYVSATTQGIGDPDGRIKWQAFKLMTDTVHEADSAHIAQNTANFAPAFSEVTSYAVGDYVTYNNVLYRCTTAHTAGVWVAGHFTSVTVGGDLSDIMPSTPSNGLITITSISGANANATTTYTNVGVGDLVNVVIDSGVLFIPSWWGTVSGLSSLGITHIQNIQGISGECRILARVCKTDGSLYLDFLRDSGVATQSMLPEFRDMTTGDADQLRSFADDKLYSVKVANAFNVVDDGGTPSQVPALAEAIFYKHAGDLTVQFHSYYGTPGIWEVFYNSNGQTRGKKIV